MMKEHRSDISIFNKSYPEATCCYYLVNFDHLVKAIPARFLHCKVTSFSLSMLYLLTAAAKSLQSCPTLGNPIDGSPPGSTIPGILPPGKNTGVGCHFLLQCMKVKSQSEVAQSCLTLIVDNTYFD